MQEVTNILEFDMYIQVETEKIAKDLALRN